MAIALPGVDKVPDGALRDFVAALHEIYDAAGQPAARVIAKATGVLPAKDFQSVSHETASAVLRGSALPAWEKVKSMVHVLATLAPSHPDPAALELQMNELWQAARREEQEAVTTTPAPEPAAVVIPVQPRPNVPAEPVEVVLPRTGTRPAATAGFVGREDLLDAMHARLTSHTDLRLVLHGPLGIGKTQVILRYLDLHKDDAQPVWWVPAASAEAIQAAMVELAAMLGVARHHRIDRTVRMVLEELESRQFPYLMVFDGLDSSDLLRFVPQGGRVVITTCDPAMGTDGTSVGLEVTDLTGEEAAELLQREPGANDAWVWQVVDTYGRTPLALCQTLSWWRARNVPLDMSDGVNAADRLAVVPADSYGSDASIAVLQAFDRLEAASPPALLLLESLARFAAVPISKKMLSRAVAATASPDALRGDVALSRAIAALCRQGLARLTDEGRRVELMPLARLVMRRALAGADAERARDRAHALLSGADPGWPDDQADEVDLYREIAEHVDATGLVDSRNTAVRLVVYNQIRFRHLVGEHAEARRLGERAYAVWQAGNDPAEDDHLVLRVSQAWANALRAEGQYDKAAELTRTAMSQLRNDPAYGDNHSHTLGMAGSRAADLRISGDYQRALEFDEDTLERSEGRFGDEHPGTTRGRHNLAISLRLVGRFADAEAKDRTALAQYRHTFGDGNWRTLLSVNALAEDLIGQCRYEDVLNEVAPMVARVEERPRTWMDRGLILAGRALALALRGTGRSAEALKLLKAAEVQCERLFGERHEYTLAVQMSHANTLHVLGRTSEATGAAVRVAELYRRRFGGRNPLTVAAEINLATVLRTNGDYARAVRIDLAGNEVLLDTVGREHPFSVAATVNLASDYAGSGHPRLLEVSRQAVKLAQRVYEDRPGHLDVVAAEANLAIDLTVANHPAAVQHRQRVLQYLTDRYGPDHAILGIVVRGRRLDCILEPPLP